MATRIVITIRYWKKTSGATFVPVSHSHAHTPQSGLSVAVLPVSPSGLATSPSVVVPPDMKK